MNFNPLDQFKIVKIFAIDLLGFDISITNSSLSMTLICTMIVLYYYFAFKNIKLIPSRVQASAELIIDAINSMIEQNTSTKGEKFFPLIFTLFIFVLGCNLFGMLPYSFTVTSHISITFMMSTIFFVIITIYSIITNKLNFIFIFVPKNIPRWMIPIMVIIELFSFLSKPIILCLRLTINMIAGHIILKILALSVVAVSLYLKPLPIFLTSILIGFEIFISILQAYIFSILSCVYLGHIIDTH
ncbi:F0F1 ATP synthase subunit A [Rickettsia endosymbiont of Cardiosporidium cionae]|uniref:F0F1 ATP synthase subunit A n=1 Tax=Rickettsia endosymbiont of Cardiosporidium cionae TaxID=2777155 RepID=UPI001893647C|nr:F0F1 ATP synthase subunit A [Rickettsia endosymbiont of Cardiosporidium cionae]KAF8818586.1 F0F1 ATP synthase subunit A [Rickettsia endosymbiont of Cardiosporidium cionae]